MKHDYVSLEPARYGNGVSVYGFSTYDRHSVLAGQVCKQFLGGFDSEAEARAAFPQAEDGLFYRDAGNTFDHLPGEDDPVPGGAYPDDWLDDFNYVGSRHHY